ncbi:23S rRNA (uracil(1939)-C(5))-methyltransferase RlmD [Miniphocaeibacter massiliensis]|uniref:23S rRNA (uracil(1939)-C(5))-methyltransferase RlmD n=1 Tax=Miniphocaeibacter massiliensis TaxID=2041841 RepID=UPI000C1BE571|nr:23S rRNA (uracil(1939)-C(5))-methyltransferase RlmD [Miniphocaeibacter massiliensis]
MKVENLKIIDITEEGNGVAKKDNLVYFAEDTVIDEIVDIEVLEKKKNFIIGKRIRTVEKSSYRINSKCEYAKVCTGCTMQETDYSKELELKKNLVKNQISRIGNFNVDNTNIIGLENPCNFRNKIELKVDSKCNLGYYYKKSHKLISIDKCIVASIAINKVMKKISNLVKKYNIEGYEHKTNKGIIKNITIRSNYLNEIQLTLTVAKENFSNKKELFEELEQIEEIIELYYSVNKKKNNEFMGEEVNLIYSKKEFIDMIGDYKFKISPKSFFQVNSKNTKKLYDIALKQMDLKGTEKLLDLYCGIGTTTIYFGNKTKEAIGVEIVKDAVKDANYNKELNNIKNVKFIHGKSENEIEKLLKDDIDIVVVDPPRKGLDRNLIEILGKSKINKIEYISCNPGTFSRDLKYLKEYEFEIKEIELCDMFPNTMHVECVALIERK